MKQHNIEGTNDTRIALPQ